MREWREKGGGYFGGCGAITWKLQRKPLAALHGSMGRAENLTKSPKRNLPKWAGRRNQPEGSAIQRSLATLGGQLQSVVLLRLGIVSRSSRQAARTDNELGQQTAHTPPVHRHAMTLPVAQEELGRHVLQCADI